MLKRIVDTDNFGRDYSNEMFLPIPNLTKKRCKDSCKHNQ